MQGFNLRVEWKWLIDKYTIPLSMGPLWSVMQERGTGATMQFPKVSFYSRWLDYDTDE